MADPAAAWAALASLRTLTLATTGRDGAPRLRLVVPRGVDPSARRVRFYTDGRSAKVAEIAGEARVALLGWQEAERVQWRLDGRAAIAAAGETDAAWAALRPGADRDYATALPPGDVLAGALDQVDAGAARAHFMVIDIVVAAIERLRLDPAGHARSRMVWDGTRWAVTRLVP